MMELYEGGWLDVINAVDLALQSQAANADAQDLWSQSEAMKSENLVRRKK